MRIGITIGGTSTRTGLDGLSRRARDLESRGFSTLWIPNVFGHDAITTSTVIGHETQHIEIGTAVVPTFPRHPTALAQQALTAAAACRGRFTLGIGLSFLSEEGDRRSVDIALSMGGDSMNAAIGYTHEF